ncbi:PDZ domain-containing protein [Terribacillus sp. FSL K6-0262]|uniref:PDZ domain-containing protein n=1 Tax=Terribacillus sp. FSL K6-0262 TaxID=2921447 RepID=UPI0030EF682C
MLNDWLTELLYGIGNFFLNPLLYWGLLLTLFVSSSRIRKERNNFGTKVFDFGKEWTGTWMLSLIFALLLTAVSIGAGIVMAPVVVLLISAVTIVLTLLFRFTWLSSAYIFGFSFLLAVGAAPYAADYLPAGWADDLEGLNWISFALIMSILMLAEAVLLLKTKREDTLPELVKGPRGRWIGQHRFRKLLFIPFVLLVPAGAIEPFAPWWPFFHLNGTNYGLLLVPLLTGIDGFAKGRPAFIEARKQGKAVLILAFLTLAVSLASMYSYYFAIAAFVIALIGREAITLYFRSKDRKRKMYYTESSKGLFVLAVIPQSPADRLGILAGERIEKVNGIRVTTERAFYEAIQTNSQYCKMEIRDDQGEIRIKQRAMYEGEPHELGIIFVQEQWRYASRESS